MIKKMSPHVDKKKILNVNIINFEKVDKSMGRGLDNVDKVFMLNFSIFFMLCGPF